MKTSNHLNLIAVGKDVRDQGNPFARSERRIDQSSPCRGPTAREERVRCVRMIESELNPTRRMKFVTYADASEAPYSSIFVSMPIDRLSS